MSRKIRFAVCGFGYIGKRHARVISQLQDADLTAIIDIDSRLEQEADTFVSKATGKKVPFYTSFESALAANPGIDVVNICTPNGLHASQCLQSLDHDCHVVCEKPMALSKADCEAVVYKAFQKSKQVYCVMQNRYSPSACWLKKVITENILGDIYFVQVNCFWNRDERYYKKGSWHGDKVLDGGPLFTQFSHFIDILYWLLGDITQINAKFFDFNHSHNTDFEDSGTVFFNLLRGGSGAIHYSTSIYDKNFESSISIIGENGTVRVGGQYMNEVTYCHVKDYILPNLEQSAPPNDYGGYQGSADNHIFVIKNVIEHQNNQSFPMTNAMEGLKVVDIIERIYETRADFLRK